MEANTSSAGQGNHSENVRVVVRTRPLSESEIYLGCVEIVSVDPATCTVNVENLLPIPELSKTFAFDYVFGTEAPQLNVYAETTRPIVDSVIKGYNGTVLAYGQMAAGKTYTMFGKQDSPVTAGIVPNVFAQLYSHIARTSDDKKFLVCVSYFEIYDEEIRDLISNDRNLEIRECQGLGVYVQGLTAYLCRTAADIHKVLKVGEKNRSLGATAIIEESSRKHTILTVTVECSYTDADSHQRITQGKLNLVDLASSGKEIEVQASGERSKDFMRIDLSLSVLGDVISALVDEKSGYIPYQNSKLTRLLQDSLGGSAKTVMIANISPACISYKETINTLRYANRVKEIKNVIKMNEEPKDTLIRKFELHIFNLHRQLRDAANRKIIIGVEVEEHLEEISAPEVVPVIGDQSEPGSSGIVKSETMIHKASSSTSSKAVKMEELSRTISERDFLAKELERVSSLIIVGGMNLLEKAQLQNEILETASQDLVERKQSEEQVLENQPDKAQTTDIQEQYEALSEVSSKTKKWDKLLSIVNAAKTNLSNVQSEQPELEGSLENIRMITHELCDAVKNNYIPKEYMNLIDSIGNYNEETEEWQLKCAFTGSKKQKIAEVESNPFVTWLFNTPEFPVYVQYGKKLEIDDKDKVITIFDSRTTSHPFRGSDSESSENSEIGIISTQQKQGYIKSSFSLSSQKTVLKVPRYIMKYFF